MLIASHSRKAATQKRAGILHLLTKLFIHISGKTLSHRTLGKSRQDFPKVSHPQSALRPFHQRGKRAATVNQRKDPK
jgi:hypothetical protein